MKLKFNIFGEIFLTDNDGNYLSWEENQNRLTEFKSTLSTNFFHVNKEEEGQDFRLARHYPDRIRLIRIAAWIGQKVSNLL